MDFSKLITQRLNESADLKKSFSQDLITNISAAADSIIAAYKNGNKVLIMGNGGSAADAQHMAAELVGRFYKERKPLQAMALHANTSALTAIANDYGYEHVFERQIEAFGKKGDVAIGISTSGKSPNILLAFEKAKSIGMKTIALTGEAGMSGKALADLTIAVPSKDTPRIQEAHLTIEHIICEIVEREMFG